MIETLAQGMVAAGFALMVFNIINVVHFIHNQHDVITGESETRFSYAILVFVVCFAIVYGVIFFQNFAEITIGVILLSGSAFVTVVLQWIFRLIRSVKETTMEMAEALSTVIDARDPHLRGHSLHVERLVLLLYDALPEEEQHALNRNNLQYAAIFHDLGKLGVSESILNKPGLLDDMDWSEIRKHPKIGVDILRPVSSFVEIQDWIEYHHERIDGKGYYGLSGDEIPFGARIITVADVFSAVLMRRPYKEPSTYDDCIEILKDNAGTQLDAHLVEVFCSIPKERVIACSDVLLDHPYEEV